MGTQDSTFFSMIADNLVFLLPLFIIQLSLMIFCLVKISKEGVGNLNKLAWILIIIFVNFFGPILYLALGRKKDVYDQSE